MHAKWKVGSAAAAAVLCMAAGSGLAMSQTSSTEAGNAASAASPSAHLSRSDREFMRKAARGGFAEIETGRLAQQQAQVDSVKSFGARMVKDHSEANDKLMALAQNLNVTLPTKPGRADVKQMDKLKSLSGKAFDKAYAREMVKDHRMDIRDFEHEAKYGKNPDVKSFAEATLPVLREHLSLAEQLPGERRTASAAGSAPAER